MNLAAGLLALGLGFLPIMPGTHAIDGAAPYPACNYALYDCEEGEEWDCEEAGSRCHEDPRG